MNNTVEEWLFSTFQGSAATVYRWGRQINTLLLLNFLRISCTKNHKIGWFLTSHRCHNQRLLYKHQRLFSCKIRSLSLSFCHFGLRRVNTTRNNRLVGSYVLNKRAKFDAKIFTHFWEIAVYALGRFILTHPVHLGHSNELFNAGFAREQNCLFVIGRLVTVSINAAHHSSTSPVRHTHSIKAKPISSRSMETCRWTWHHWHGDL